MPPESGDVSAEQCQSVLGPTFRQVLGVPVALHPEMTARDVEEWDSLAHVRLLLTIERKFQIKFSASEVGGLKTVGDLVLLIERKSKT
jgi:acyl carrier protein